MKKVIILFFLLFMLSGCTVVRIDTTDIDNIINVILSKDNKLYNQVGKGYKYYVPRGVTYIDTNELNDKLYSNGNYYYLYIDVINYYYQTDINYKKNKKSYYSNDFEINGKKGYLQIDKYGDKYLIKFVYNYAKMETYVDKEDINNAVLNCSYILSTIKFNHNVIKLMLDDDYFTSREEKYDKFTAKKPISNTVLPDKEDEIVDDNLDENVDDNESLENEENKEEGME